MHREMSTFLHEGEDTDRKEAWRKCWVCDIKVYRTTDKKESDMAPSECWVEVDFNSGVVVSCGRLDALTCSMGTSMRRQ